MAGKFIVFEGIDGAGTTTQAALLVKALDADGIPALATFEPTDRPAGKLIKKLLKRKTAFNEYTQDNLLEKHLALLFAADRLDHLANKVLPALEKDTHVVSDRYVLSSLAYQSIDCPPDWVRELNKFAVEPDMTIFLDVDVDTALERIDNRENKKEIFETRDKLEIIRASYIRMLDDVPDARKAVLDGALPKEEIHNQSLGIVRKIIPG